MMKIKEKMMLKQFQNKELLSKLTLYFQTSMPQSTLHGAKEEITDEKTANETSDQPEEEYGFMEPMTLDSEDEDEVENVPKNVPDIVPKRQKSPEREIDAQKEDNVLNMESITIDTENKEAKIEVKEDKIPQVCSQNSIFLTKLLRFL